MNKDLFMPANVLIPKEHAEKWSVIACDQYTSDPEYWSKLKSSVGNTPSALNIILPEVFLDNDNGKKISEINTTMQKYLDGDVFCEYKNTFIYTKRTLNNGNTRRGVVGLIDLEDYSFEAGSKALIRATERTVPERIPPRVEIRQGAPLEMPHVMLLINDGQKTVIEPLDTATEGTAPIYDFDLLMNGGHIVGKPLDEETAQKMQKALSDLLKKSRDGMLFAVGDGNHSLASAKECYRLNKTAASRYALVEVVNIHDPSLVFEPIYRVLFGVEPEKVIEDFVNYCGGSYFGEDALRFTCVWADKEEEISVKPISTLCVGALQSFINKLLDESSGIKVDYIHGEDAVRNLSSGENTLGFLFDGMKKSDLFTAVENDGSLPRKTFSMGNADDKRFYLECRRL